jgi:hypothetical protein
MQQQFGFYTPLYVSARVETVPVLIGDAVREPLRYPQGRRARALKCRRGDGMGIKSSTYYRHEENYHGKCHRTVRRERAVRDAGRVKARLVAAVGY